VAQDISRSVSRYKKMLFCATGDNNLQLREFCQPGPFQTGPNPRTRPLGATPHALLSHQASGCLIALMSNCFEVIADHGRGGRVRFDLPPGERPSCATTWYLDDGGVILFPLLPSSTPFKPPHPPLPQTPCKTNGHLFLGNVSQNPNSM